MIAQIVGPHSQTHGKSFYILSIIGFMEQEAPGTRMLTMVNRTEELAGLLQTLAKGTGKRMAPTTFAGRFRIQKAVFLLRAQGHDFSASYRFSMYLKGPYSTTLSKDYYEISETSVEPKHVSVPDRMMEVVKEAMDGGDPFLETVVTMLSIHETNSPGADRELVYKVTRRLKPKLAHHYDPAWTFLERKGFV
jgi:uncharacterized protein YwgA